MIIKKGTPMTHLYVSSMFLFRNKSFNHALYYHVLYVKMWHKTKRVMGKIIIVIQF